MILLTAGRNYIMGMPPATTSCSTRPPPPRYRDRAPAAEACGRRRSLNAGWKRWALWQMVAHPIGRAIQTVKFF